MKTKSQILTELVKMSPEARQLFAALLVDGETCRRGDYDYLDGWDELIAADLVNCWCDDTGLELCQIGTHL